MPDVYPTRLRTIGELAHQHRSTEDLLRAISDLYPEMTIDEIQAALRRAGDLYHAEADRHRQDRGLLRG